MTIKDAVEVVREKMRFMQNHKPAHPAALAQWTKEYEAFEYLVKYATCAKNFIKGRNK